MQTIKIDLFTEELETLKKGGKIELFESEDKKIKIILYAPKSRRNKKCLTKNKKEK